MTRFKAVALFLLAVGCGIVIWGFLFRVLGASHPNNRFVQGLAATGAI